MATTNLSAYDFSKVPNGAEMNIGIIVSEWNSEITLALLAGAKETLMKHGVKEKNIVVKFVPGSFELSFGARMMAEELEIDAIIALGCIIKGGTPHFKYICQGVAYGMQELNMDYDIPFIFGVLTTDNLEQAQERAGGKCGNKGDEAAVSAIKMIDFNCKLQK